MFKRVERRLKRKEREDELGLDEDMKGVLGLNDTDSDESESDVDSDSHGDTPDADSDDDGADAPDEIDWDEGNDEEEDSDNEVDQHSEERALITIAEALTNPIFLVSLDPAVNECIVCPGKQLKNQKMVETHKSSNAHERRFKQFKNLAASADVKSIAQDFIEKHMSDKQPQLSTNSGTSKRAEKKRVAQEKRKAKREKFKARQKAKKEALVHSSSATTSKGGETSTKAEKFVGKETSEEEDKNVPKGDGDKPKKKHKKKGETASEALIASKDHNLDPPASPPKKKPRASKSMDATPVPTTVAATTNFDSSSRNLQAGPRVSKAEKKVSEDNGDKPWKKHKKKNDNASEILKPSEHAISDPPQSSLKKKRKINPSITKPQAPNQKSKPASTPAPALTDESPQLISELQAQVKDIIKSASDLAKAARARALNGGDSGDETKSSAMKKTKKKAIKTKQVRES